MGLFYPFLNDEKVNMVGVEAGGKGVDTGQHAASLNAGRPGVLHGNRTYLLQDSDGQIIEAHSISAGLDYPGVGPEHAWLLDGQIVALVSTVVMMGAVNAYDTIPFWFILAGAQVIPLTLKKRHSLRSLDGDSRGWSHAHAG